MAMSRQSEERKVSFIRLTVLRVAVVAAFLVLAGTFWFFQIIEHEQFREMAENNHQRELALRAPRGVLFDRNGRVLVENRPTFNVSIVRLKTTDLDRTVHLVAAGCGRRRARRARHRRSPPARALVPADRRHRERDARAGGGDQRPAPRLRVAGRRRAAGADAPVPAGRARRTPVRLRGRGHRPAGRRGFGRSRAAPSSGRPVSRRRTTRC